MNSIAPERILLIGDNDRQLSAALSHALPGAQVTSARNYFDAIADLAGSSYTAILAAAAPIERRPEPAIRTLRELAGESRLMLFGSPGYEPLSRKMLDFGLDDYILTPAHPVELQQMLGAPPLRLTTTADAEIPEDVSDEFASIDAPPRASRGAGRLELLAGLPLAELMLEMLVHQPHDAPRAAVGQINARIGPSMRLVFANPGAAPLEIPEGQVLLSHAVRTEARATDGDGDGGASPHMLQLLIPRDEDETAARHVLAHLSQLVAMLSALQDRHTRLQRLAISDDLTGLYNGRYFRVFLSQILEKARLKRFPVTLLLFDIDNFKSYNDRFGHCVGDEILKQTAQLIRSCCREHDHVARVSGDEFAVVFWEKEGPRQPRDAKSSASNVAIPGSGSRVPQTIVQILERFRHAIATSDLKMLGPQGRGCLSISGGLAVYPYDAHTSEALYDAADKALMFGAKKSGKNSIFLVGNPQPST